MRENGISLKAAFKRLAFVFAAVVSVMRDSSSHAIEKRYNSSSPTSEKFVSRTGWAIGKGTLSSPRYVRQICLRKPAMPLGKVECNSSLLARSLSRAYS